MVPWVLYPDHGQVPLMDSDSMSIRRRFTAKWRQGIFTAFDQKLLLGWMLLQATFRGIDYITGTYPNGPEWVVLNHAFASGTVGTWFVVGALMTMAGVLFRTHLWVWLGHGMLYIAYWAMAISTILGMMRAGAEADTALRVPGILFGAGLMHFIWWMRTGRDPLPQADEQHAEEVSGPGGGE